MRMRSLRVAWVALVLISVLGVFSTVSGRTAEAATLSTCSGACSEWSMNSQEGNALSTWQINFTVGSAWSAGQPLTITAPAGTTLPTSSSDYTVYDRGGLGPTAPSAITVVSPSEVTIDSPFGTISGSDQLLITVTGVGNPPPGGYAGSDFCIDDGYGQSCLTGTLYLSGVALSLSASQVAANGQVTVSGAVYTTSGADSGASVSLSDGGAGGTFTQPSPATLSDGSYGTTYTAGATGGAFTLTASTSASGVTPSTANQPLQVMTAVGNVSFAAVPAIGNATNVSWTVQFTTTSPLAAGSGSITLQAPSGTVLPLQSSAYGVDGAQPQTVTPGGGPNQVNLTVSGAIGAGTTVTVNVSGVQNPPVASYPASAFSVYTSSDLMSVNPSSGTTFTTGSPTQVVLTGSLAGTVASSADLGPATVTVEDQYNNPVQVTSPVTVQLSSATATGEFSASFAGGPITSVTIPTGQSSASFYFGDTTAGSETVTAAASGLTAGSHPLTLQPGPPTKLGFLTEPGDAVAGSPFGIQPVVAVEDSFGNVIKSSSALSPYGVMTAAITPGTGASGANLYGAANIPLDPFFPGEALFNSIAIDTAGNGYTLTATDNGLSAVSDAFDVAAEPVNITLTLGSPAVGAGGEITVSGKVTDASDNPVGGVSIVLDDGGAGGSFSVSPGTPPAYTDTASDGTFTSIYTASTTPQTVVISAATDNYPPQTSANLQVTAAAPDPSYSALSGPSHPVVAGTGNVAITAMLEDAYYNPVTGLTAADFSLASSDPQVGSLTPVSVTESGSTPGTYTIVVTDTDANSGNAQNIAVVADGVTLLPSVATVTVVPAQPAAVSLAASPQAAQVNVPVTVSGTVTDAYGNPVPGIGLTMSDGGAGGGFGTPNLATASDGTFSTTYTAPAAAGNVTLTAETTNLVQGTALLSVKPEAVDASEGSVSGPGTVQSGPSDVTLQVAVVDQAGLPYSGLTAADFSVTSSDAAAGTLTPLSVTGTGPPGTYSVVLTDTDANQGSAQTLTVFVDGIALANTAAVTVQPGPATSFTLSTSVPWVAVNGTVSVTVSAADAFGNPIAGLPVNFLYVNDSGTDLRAAANVTASDGSYTDSFQVPATQGSITISVSTPSPALTATTAIFVTSAPGLVTQAGGVYIQPGGASSLHLTSGGITDTKVAASGLTGTVTAADYSGDPAGAFSTGTAFFDVHLGNATLTNSASLTISQCAGVSSSETLYWWNGTAWTAVSPAATFDAATGCLSTTLTASSSPTLAELGGTPFAAAPAPSSPPAGGGPSATAPMVSSISPATGPASGGTVVAISGSGFTGATGVSFGTAPAAHFQVESDGAIQATSPAGSGSVDVTVTTPAGTSAKSAADEFTYAASSGCTSGSQPTFSDMPSGYWAYGAISTMACKGIVSGFADGTFRPGGAVTRAEFVKMLVLSLGLKPVSGSTSFTDVPASSWAAPYVLTAVQAGIARGTTATTFDPNGDLTREQMAVLLARALKLTKTTALTFKDDAKIAGWALQDVEAVVAAGYMPGYPDGTFRPEATTTRAQAAAVLAVLAQQQTP